MSHLLITGADGFVGRHLTTAAVAAGHRVTAAIAPNGLPASQWFSGGPSDVIETKVADLRSSAQISELIRDSYDAVIHLAAIASGSEARRDPTLAWTVNTLGTATMASAMAKNSNPATLLLISTGEVYGAGHDDPIPETENPAPVSPYAASKLSAEIAALEVARRTGLKVIIARPFPHTGPGQDERFVIPAFARRLRESISSGDLEVPVGNLSAIRDFLDVRDVARAYLLLAERGTSGQVYNVASGVGHRLSDCFELLAGLINYKAMARQDVSLLRPADIPCLIGSPARLMDAIGWQPTFTFPQTLQDLVNAQTD